MSSHASAAEPNTQAILSCLRAHQPRWSDPCNLQRVRLFGFVARGDANEESDVDGWLELEPLIPFATEHRKQELELLSDS